MAGLLLAVLAGHASTVTLVENGALDVAADWSGGSLPVAGTATGLVNITAGQITAASATTILTDLAITLNAGDLTESANGNITFAGGACTINGGSMDTDVNSNLLFEDSAGSTMTFVMTGGLLQSDRVIAFGANAAGGGELGTYTVSGGTITTLSDFRVRAGATMYVSGDVQLNIGDGAGDDVELLYGGKIDFDSTWIGSLVIYDLDGWNAAFIDNGSGGSGIYVDGILQVNQTRFDVSTDGGVSTIKMGSAPVYENVTSISSGAWESNSTWSGSSVPVSTNNVDLFYGVSVTINSDAACSSLLVGNIASVSKLLLQSGSLTAAANIKLSRSTSDASSLLQVSGGALSVPVLRCGDNDTGPDSSTRLEIRGGTVNITDSLKLYALDGAVEVAVTGSGADISLAAFEASSGATHPYELVFSTDSSGVATIDVSGAAAIGSNLVAVTVDFEDYTGGEQVIELLAANALAGSFADIVSENLSPFYAANFSVNSSGLRVALAQVAPGLAVDTNGVPVDVEMTFIDPHWKVRWPTRAGYRYQVQVTDDLSEPWKNHGEKIIGTGWAHTAYIPLSSNGFARVLVSARTGETQSDNRPNVLLICADDMNDWPGFMTGYSLTPNLDSLAERGMSFRNTHITTTYCTPSRTALMTGKAPYNTGCYADQVYFQFTDLESLPAYFKRAGYYTYNVGKTFHHMPGYIDMAAYSAQDHWNPNEKLLGWGLNAWSDDNLALPSDSVLISDRFGAIPNEDEPYMADTITCDFAVAKLQETYTKPFFMTVGTYAPHLERFAPQKYFDLHPTNSMYMPEVHLDDLDDLDPSLQINRLETTPEGDVDFDFLRREIQAYHACVTYADAQIGRVLDALAASPYADNTIVMFWSDNGYHLGEKVRTGKHTVWERTSNIPNIWAGPGIPSNTVYDGVVGLMDTYPTLVEMCGLPEVGNLDGESLVPIFQNPTNNYNRVVVQVSHDGDSFAVITDDWRYIDRPGDMVDELYDWRVGSRDVQELTNLIDHVEYADVIAELAVHVPTHPAAAGPVRGSDPGNIRLITSKVDPTLGETWYWEVVP